MLLSGSAPFGNINMAGTLGLMLLAQICIPSALAIPARLNAP
jgi:hypothetical protein